ncbi:hypothetical protein GCG54_00010218 [Colletotrichum gloeosporioides]|uniref:Uncharacterized protein n=1 Tax=Colletotrichum gloeosporioides TaxID=474922 RepID=A0A8H4FH96_COLGL|nr:uncharacterized protein GCG54_00010218 [Colletotrichum gloeosporioides]KAF3800944.1 hypothetical protein GCG54_00010218 [Colletotrichum gloeosporioides]
MFTTKPLSSFKKAISSIHQPLPLSSRESQKLLNVLKTSFRQNLDKEHGWTPETAESPASQTTANKPTPHNAHHRPTDRHLRTILSNPLFKNSEKPAKLPLTSPRDPMDVFEEAAARGMMTRKAATGCLRATRKQILESSVISLHDAMADSMAGSQVLQWLRSSGQERTLEFLADKPFVFELSQFLVAEGLEEVQWTWAERMVRGEGPEDPNSVIVGSLVANLVKAKSNMYDESLDTAYSAMLRADQTWKTDAQRRNILLAPWHVLSWRSTVEAWKRPLPSAALFESFVGTANHIHRPLKIDRAHLDLHHPVNPSHQRAVGFLEGLQANDKLAQLYAANNLGSRVICMGMDAVSHLTRLGRADEAESVLRILQSKFAEEVWQERPRHALRAYPV